MTRYRSAGSRSELVYSSRVCQTTPRELCVNKRCHICNPVTDATTLTDHFESHHITNIGGICAVLLFAVLLIPRQ